MALFLDFGKYKGTSLEEIALGKNPQGSKAKSVGYYYFNQLGNGDPKYFGRFQSRKNCMDRWQEIHYKLNSFESIASCSICHERPSKVISIAYGYGGQISTHGGFVACHDSECQRALTANCDGAILYSIGFDLILGFGWSGGGDKGYEKKMTEIMRDLAGWKKGKRLTPESATKFINNLKIK